VGTQSLSTAAACVNGRTSAPSVVVPPRGRRQVPAFQAGVLGPAYCQGVSTAPSGCRRVGAVIASGVLVSVALYALWDHRAGATPWALAGFDVVVGLGIGLAAWLSPVPAAQRWLLWSVGASWLLASVVPLPLLHQGLLVLVLGWFPVGLPRDRPRWALLMVAALVALGLGGQVVAGGSLVLAGILGTLGRDGDAVRWFPVTAGVGLGAGLFSVGVISAVSPRSLDPGFVLVIWETALLATAAAHVVAARSATDSATRRVLQILTSHRDRSATVRLAAVEAILRDVLRDPALRLSLADRRTGRVDAPPGSRMVSLDGVRAAAVTTTSTLLEDPVVARVLDRTLALSVRSLRLAVEREEQLEELKLARRRLMVAGDLERERLARLLQADVVVNLDEARAILESLTPASRIDEVRVASGELRGAQEDIDALLRGVPPRDLGGGRVVAAIRELASSVPVSVDVEVQGEVAASARVEATVYYVCSEALTNAVKHSGAGRVNVRLTAGGGDLRITVSDDGDGGADPAGSGLAGLRDRVVSLDGSWDLQSTSDGTKVTASLPTTQPMRRQGSAM
jgi:signal transduction histidine kinase